MKKVIALALSLIMVLAMGVTSFAASLTTIDAGGSLLPADLGFTPIDPNWDIDNEAAVFIPYDIGDAATLIDGTETVAALFEDAPEGDTLSSIKVESEKGIVDVSVYKLNDYVKSLTYDAADNTKVTGIKTKSSWPFDDFELDDIVPKTSGVFDAAGFTGTAGDYDLDLYFIYFDIPTYGGAKLSTDNYFTLKFRENTTGSDYIEESEKVWFCVYPWVVDEDDVDTYADEDEAMELADGNPMIEVGDDTWDDLFDNLYEDVPHAEADLDDYIMFVDKAAATEAGIDIDDTPYIIEKDSWKEIVGSTLIVEADDDLDVEIGKIVKGQSSISFAFDTDVEDAIQDLNEDAELAALKFLDVSNVLDSDFTVKYTFEIEDAAKAGDYFLYELVGDKLTLNQKVAVGKGDDEVDVKIERKAGDTLGQYYLSDVELATEAAAATDEENPNTGASEVAGVAVALAVISLVSAAAVSLKK